MDGGPAHAVTSSVSHPSRPMGGERFKQLQLDAEGFCIDVAVTNAELTDLMRIPWRGQRWQELCVDEHAERAQTALSAAIRTPNTPNRVDLNIRASETSDELPMSFRLIQPTDGEGVIAVGQHHAPQAGSTRFPGGVKQGLHLH